VSDRLSKRVLVVDDEVSLLRAVAVCLRVEGFDVTTARGGREALVQVSAAMPDLIVSDIRMPGMDGYALVRHLRSSPGTDLIPVVFLTARDETADRVRGFRSGVDAYLTKPFEPAELAAVVRGILSRVERTHGKIARLVGAAEQDDWLGCRDEGLTGAEELVAAEVARGLTNKEIAAPLDISVKTAGHHVEHIYAKAGVTSRAGATLFAMEHGIAGLPGR